MKHQQLFIKTFVLTCIYIIVCMKGSSQIPVTNRALHYGGSSVDVPYVIKFTTGGGTISAGYTDSKDWQVNTHEVRDDLVYGSSN